MNSGEGQGWNVNVVHETFMICLPGGTRFSRKKARYSTPWAKSNFHNRHEQASSIQFNRSQGCLRWICCEHGNNSGSELCVERFQEKGNGMLHRDDSS